MAQPKNRRQKARDHSTPVAFVGLALIASCGGPDSRFEEFGQSIDLALWSDLQPGDVAVVSGIGVVVPEPGMGVVAETLFEDGSTVLLELETDAAGRVLHGLWPAPLTFDTSRAALRSSSPSACSDSAYSLLSFRWKNIHHI